MSKPKQIKLTPQYSEKGRLAQMGIKDPSNLASQVTKDFNNAEQTKWLWIPQQAENLKGYYGVTPAAEWPFKGASRFKSNFQRIVVDTLSGNLLNSFFGPEKPLKVDPAPLNQKSDTNTLDNIAYVEDFHNSVQEHEYGLRQVLDKAIPTSLIESFCVLHPVYEYLTNTETYSIKRWVTKDLDLQDLTYDPDTDSIIQSSTQKFVHSVNLDTAKMTPQELVEAGMQEIEFDVDQESIVKDGVSIKMINGYRFYLPLGAPGENPYEKVQRAPYVVHQLFYTLKEVQDLQEEGYFENIDPVIATVYDRQRELLTYIKLQEAGFLLDTARLEYEYVEVLKETMWWKVNGKKQLVTVWMDKGSSQIFRVEKNVYGIKPYFPLVPFPVDETPYGESLCQIIRGHVKDLDLLIRTVINVAIMKSAPPKFFDPAGGFNPATVGNFGPNSYIPTREPSKNIFQPPTPEDPAVAIQMIQFIINIIERITGVNEVIQGQVAKKSNTTATEINNATARSGVRFDTIYQRYKDQLRPMIRYIHKLYLRNMPEEKEMMLMGRENKGRLAKIHRQQLQGAYEFDFAGNSVVQEQGLLQKAITLFQTVGQHPYLSYKAESIYYMLYNIIRGLNPVAMDKILPKPEEVQKIEQQNQQAQRQQEQMAMQMQQQQAQNNPEAQKAQQQMAMQQQQHQMDMQGKVADLQMKSEEHRQKLTHREKEAQIKIQQAAALAQIKVQAQQQQAENELMMMKARARAEASTTGQQTKDANTGE